MEPLFIGIIIGFVLGAAVIGILWNETLYDENDQKIKRNNIMKKEECELRKQNLSKYYGMKPQHIYITSDEVKKNGEWVLSNLNEVIRFCSLYCQNSYKKIILTTDQDLIKDGVQAIDDEFLYWFEQFKNK